MAAAHRDSIHALGSRFYPPPGGGGLERRGDAGDLRLGDAGWRSLLHCHRDDRRRSRGARLCIAPSRRRRGRRVGLRPRLGRPPRAGQRPPAPGRSPRAGARRRVDRRQASLAGVAFYRANGFEEVGRGEARLMTGASMECVLMRKASWRERVSRIVGASKRSAHATPCPTLLRVPPSCRRSPAAAQTRRPVRAAARDLRRGWRRAPRGPQVVVLWTDQGCARRGADSRARARCRTSR